MMCRGSRPSVSQQLLPSWMAARVPERNKRVEEVKIDKEAVEESLSAPPFKLRAALEGK